jgi:hypothetical protein
MAATHSACLQNELIGLRAFVLDEVPKHIACAEL